MISCSAPSTMISRPARSRAAKRSQARVSVTRSAPGGDDQRRRQDRAREVGVLELGASAGTRREPADRRPAEAEPRRRRARRSPCAQSARDPKSADCLRTARGRPVFEPPPGAKAPPSPSASSASTKPRTSARPLQAGEPDHRRGQHQPLERAASGMRDHQQDRRAHGMGEAEPRAADRRARAPR